MNHFADRLSAAIAEKRAPVCVGFDPVLERIPRQLLQEFKVYHRNDGSLDPRTSPEALGNVLIEFGTAVIAEVTALVPAIKINIAFFEPHFSQGIRAYFELVHRAQAAGLIVIGDIKRGDIGHSSTEYAAAHFGRPAYQEVYRSVSTDAVTLSPYLGYDGPAPFVDIAHQGGKGVFLLVQTSNPSAVQIQGLRLWDGFTLSERMGGLVEQWAVEKGLIGQCGYSNIGAVVAPVDVETTVRLRRSMAHCIFLVPGYGAQGRSAEEVARCFKDDGSGAIVNASRSVIFAFEDARYRDRHGENWRGCVREACQDFVTDVRRITSQSGGIHAADSAG